MLCFSISLPYFPTIQTKIQDDATVEDKTTTNSLLSETTSFRRKIPSRDSLRATNLIINKSLWPETKVAGVEASVAKRSGIFARKHWDPCIARIFSDSAPSTVTEARCFALPLENSKIPKGITDPPQQAAKVFFNDNVRVPSQNLERRRRRHNLGGDWINSSNSGCRNSGNVRERKEGQSWRLFHK